MIGPVRLAVLGLLFLTVLYFLLSIYSRSLARERLEKEWEEDGCPGDRDAYVDRGMAEYETSLRRKLLLLVYVVPIVGFFVLLYVTNFM
ncbi:MAG: hypothetical protein HUJ27_16820 [Rhodobacteraceae bacterium]|nr:hypothetical protein [Paracoccaceae bacterium]